MRLRRLKQILITGSTSYSVLSLRILPAVVAVFLASNVVCQNLVPNPSFEEKSFCPPDPSSFLLLENWGDYQVIGSPDFYHECGVPGAKPTDQVGGFEYPADGVAYIGLVSYSKNFKNYREAAQCKLLQPLEGDTGYCLTFYLSLADSSLYSSNSFGVLFRKDSVPVLLSSEDFFALIPQIQLSVSLDQKIGWVKVQLEYQATGGEEFLIMGNFLPDSLTHTKPETNGFSNDAYYYIDKVCLFKRPQLHPLSEKVAAICEGVSVEIGAVTHEGFSYSWSSPGGEVLDDSTSMITVSPPVTTTYILTAYGEDHCGITFYDTITVTVKNCNATTPNVFTPNADGRNDLFLVQGVDVAYVDRCRIFNRWGVQIFEFTADEGWDGRLTSGEDAPEGVYFYHALINGGAGDIKGTLSLFR